MTYAAFRIWLSTLSYFPLEFNFALRCNWFSHGCLVQIVIILKLSFFWSYDVIYEKKNFKEISWNQGKDIKKI